MAICCRSLLSFCFIGGRFSGSPIRCHALLYFTAIQALNYCRLDNLISVVSRAWFIHVPFRRIVLALYCVGVLVM